MIDIIYYPKQNMLTMQGHANYAENGKDIVCAGVSALFYALATTLKDYQTQGAFENLDIDVDKGNAKIVCTPKTEWKRNIDIVFYTVLSGIKNLSENYKKNINFSLKGG